MGPLSAQVLVHARHTEPELLLSCGQARHVLATCAVGLRLGRAVAKAA
jgi:hypothetical protein